MAVSSTPDTAVPTLPLPVPMQYAQMDIRGINATMRSIPGGIGLWYGTGGDGSTGSATGAPASTSAAPCAVTVTGQLCSSADGVCAVGVPVGALGALKPFAIPYTPSTPASVCVSGSPEGQTSSDAHARVCIAVPPRGATGDTSVVARVFTPQNVDARAGITAYVLAATAYEAYIAAMPTQDAADKLRDAVLATAAHNTTSIPTALPLPSIPHALPVTPPTVLSLAAVHVSSTPQGGSNALPTQVRPLESNNAQEKQHPKNLSQVLIKATPRIAPKTALALGGTAVGVILVLCVVVYIVMRRQKQEQTPHTPLQ